MSPMGSSRQRCSQERRNDVWVSGCGAGDEVLEDSSFSKRGAPRGPGVDFLVQSGSPPTPAPPHPTPCRRRLDPNYPHPPPGEKFASASGTTQAIQAQVGNASEEGKPGGEGGQGVRVHPRAGHWHRYSSTRTPPREKGTTSSNMHHRSPHPAPDDPTTTATTPPRAKFCERLRQYHDVDTNPHEVTLSGRARGGADG